MREEEEVDGWEGGVIIGGRKINTLRYADHTTLIAKDKQEISEKCLNWLEIWST